MNQAETCWHDQQHIHGVSFMYVPVVLAARCQSDTHWHCYYHEHVPCACLCERECGSPCRAQLAWLASLALADDLADVTEPFSATVYRYSAF